MAIALTLLIGYWTRAKAARANGIAIKAVAALSLLAWLLIVLAGRWIAYADYLFPPQ